jgi:anti-anti-sigma factor
MCGADLNTREHGSHVVVLRREPGMAVAAREPQITADLAGLPFTDAGASAPLVHERSNARHPGGDLQLATPQHQVLRVLALTRLIGVFRVHAGMDAEDRNAGRSRRAALPAPRPPLLTAIT